MPRNVLDASALMALFQQEPGDEIVAQAIESGAAISTMNLSEVASRLNDLGVPEIFIKNAIQVLKLTIVDFNLDYAYKPSLLRSLTRRVGLSLGDRACLALAQQLNVPAVTADRVWEGVLPGIEVQIIR
ncbi:MAG: PIN domain-containing protein [Ktedonobacteraceae bacterium]